VFRRYWFLAATVLAAFVPPLLFAQTPAPDDSTKVPPTPLPPEWTDISVEPTEPHVVPSAPNLPAIKIPNFASCPIAELQHLAPGLAHLKPAQNQSELTKLLDQIGAVTVEISRKTPNLISHESVVSERGGVKTRQNFSYLVLQHTLDSKNLVLDEFRVDIATGEKFQTEFIDKTPASNSPAPAPSLLELPPQGGIVPPTGGPPLSQGFVNDWLYFYPSNRRQAEFRYLGQQKVDGHRTQVVAFAQKPGSVRLPATIEYRGKLFPVFVQGVAWVNASDFRILRLQVDLLSPPPGVPLRQMTADIQFAQTPIVEMTSPLWLPSQVVVTTNLGGVALRESHTYSDYRLFRTRSKIVMK